MALYTALLLFARLVPIPLIRELFFLVVAAYVGLLFLETAKFTLEGALQGPRLPELSWQNFSAGMYALVAVLIAQLPAIIGQFLLRGVGSPLPVIEVLLVPIGMYYLPMALVALADLENERALNPLLVLRGIRQMAGPYFVLVTLAALCYVIATIGMAAAEVNFVLFELVSHFLFLYLVLVLIRAVSLVFVRREVSLG